MIAAAVGRIFLNAYNERFKSNLTARDFFENVFLKIFYDHEQYLMTGGNSPLENPKIQWKKRLFPSSEERKDRIRKTIEKIESCATDASIAIGFAASDENGFATTSGLVTDININIDEDEVCLSWIGAGLGVGVSGGYTILFNEPEILLKIYEGWGVYRKYLNDNAIRNFRGNQINTWNGQWLSFVYGDILCDYGDYDFARLHAQNVFSSGDNGVEVNTINWSLLFFNISKKYNGSILNGYIYSLGQTNKTLGFYLFYFSHAKRIIDYYKILFGEEAALHDRKVYEELFGRHIKRACESGSIGLQALEPKDLRKYYGNDSNLKLIKPEISQKKGETEVEYKVRKSNFEQKDYHNIIIFRTYKTWLLAMITKNKEESLKYTAEVAEALHEYREGSTKSDRKNLIQSELLAAKSKRPFLDALVVLIKDVQESKLEMFKSLRDKVHLMSSEDFGYFVVLLKFDYAYAERERN